MLEGSNILSASKEIFMKFPPVPTSVHIYIYIYIYIYKYICGQFCEKREIKVKFDIFWYSLGDRQMKRSSSN